MLRLRLDTSSISKSQVSRLCEEIDDKVKAFLDRPIEGKWPYLWIYAAYLKVRRGVLALVGTAFAQETPEAACTQWRNVADQIRPKVPKLATLMDSAEQDVLAYMTFPALGQASQSWLCPEGMATADATPRPGTRSAVELLSRS